MFGSHILCLSWGAPLLQAGQPPPSHWRPPTAEGAPCEAQQAQVSPYLNTRTTPLHIYRCCLLGVMHSQCAQVWLHGSTSKILPKYFYWKIISLSIPAAQNNCLIDEHTAKTLCRTPCGPLPPLLELAARTVLKYQLTWQPGTVPRYLNG